MLTNPIFAFLSTNPMAINSRFCQFVSKRMFSATAVDCVNITITKAYSSEKISGCKMFSVVASNEIAKVIREKSIKINMFNIYLCNLCNCSF